jgi:glutamine amidotransferase
VEGRVARLGAGGRVPRLGWGEVVVERAGGGAAPRWLRDGTAWFAHSYALRAAPGDAVVATSDHGGALVAAFERGALLACQFHPELSGEWGAALLERWVAP